MDWTEEAPSEDGSELCSLIPHVYSGVILKAFYKKEEEEEKPCILQPFVFSFLLLLNVRPEMYLFACVNEGTAFLMYVTHLVLFSSRIAVVPDRKPGDSWGWDTILCTVCICLDNEH